MIKKENTGAPTIEINPEFQKALELMENSGRHVFITGRAGTGKSTLLSYFCERPLSFWRRQVWRPSMWAGRRSILFLDLSPMSSRRP
jgi:type IV secretory pathway VirB4 component